MTTAPATLLTIGACSASTRPTVVAVAPSKVKMREKPATKHSDSQPACFRRVLSSPPAESSSSVRPDMKEM